MRHQGLGMLCHGQQMHWMSSTTARMCGPSKSSMELRTGKSNSTQEDCWESGKASQPGREKASDHPSSKGWQSSSVLAISTGTVVLKKQFFSVSYKPSEVFIHVFYVKLRNGQKNIIGAFHCRKIEWVLHLCKTEWVDMTIDVTNTIQWIISYAWFSDVFSTPTRDNCLKISVLKGTRFLSGSALWEQPIPLASWRDMHTHYNTDMCLSLQ